MITFHIITLFPEAIRAYVGTSILGRAQKEKRIAIRYYDPRDFTKDPHIASSRRSDGYGASKYRRVDRRPYGGGPGMVLEAEPVLRAAAKAVGRKKAVATLFFSPSGKRFDSAYAKRLAKKARPARNATHRRAGGHIVLIAGHYEGVDARVAKVLKAGKVSIGPYVLTGGEVPAMVVIDAVSRFVPGVLGNYSSLEDERTASADVYTRPEVLKWRGKDYRVPKVLLSGDHAKIEKWKKRN